MTIERIPTISPMPLITQRLDVSNATALAPGPVMPLVPLGPYMAPAPDGGNPTAHLPQQAFAALADTVGPDASPHDSSAMQANQVFFSRQLVWQAPDPAAMAASWRVMVKTYGEQRAALEEQARGLHVPGNLFMAEPNPAALREGARAPLPMDTEAWRFAVYGWAGQRLTLRVLAGAEEQQTQSKRRHGKVALRLELTLQEIGRVVIQMEPVADGVLLELAGAGAARQYLRQALPEIAACMRRAGLRIVRCRLNRELHASQVHHNDPMQAAAALTLPLFRAMAEVAVLLSHPDQEPTQAGKAAAPQPLRSL